MPVNQNTSDDIITLLCDLYNESMAIGYVVGISGGIDSALAAALCSRALGPDRVLGLFLPSKVTPASDAADVELLSKTLKIQIDTIPIDQIMDQFRALPEFSDTPYLVGNLMARTRMAILYYIANKNQMLVCGTSNHTEFLLGYCTKHGDNASDVSPILHLLKTEVWELARILGVPDLIIDRVPTAGLWHGQTDEGEIGMTYAAIDSAILRLEKNGWHPDTNEEERVMDKVQKARHKQVPAPHLKRGSLE